MVNHPNRSKPHEFRLPPNTDFLLWWVRCDEWLAAAGLPGLEWNAAATLFRAGMDVDTVAREARSLADDARAVRELTL